MAASRFEFLKLLARAWRPGVPLHFNRVTDPGERLPGLALEPHSGVNPEASVAPHEPVDCH
jgi:hypothetical protein